MDIKEYRKKEHKVREFSDHKKNSRNLLGESIIAHGAEGVLLIRGYRDEDFYGLHSLMQKAFPPEECLSEKQLRLALTREGSRAFIIELQKDEAGHQEEIGFLLGYELDQVFFAEYLATKKECRNKGYGAQVLKHFMQFLEYPFVFECELPGFSPMAQRRYDFYKRLGFYEYDAIYYMPALDLGQKPIPMCLMGGGAKLEQKKLAGMIKKIYKKVYGHVIYEEQNSRLLAWASCE